MASRGRTEGIILNGRVCKTLLRQEGVAPVRFQRLENRIGLFQADAFLPDVASIGLSSPRSSGEMVEDAAVPPSRNEAPGHPKSDRRRPSVFSKTPFVKRKMAPALRLLQEMEEPETKTEGTKKPTGANDQCRIINFSVPFARNPLIRTNSRK